MAFKKIDFSALDTETAPVLDPYLSSDLHLRKIGEGKELRRGPVDVTLFDRSISPGLDDLAIPTEANGKRFDLVLTGQRARDYRKTVRAALEERRREILGAKPLEDLDQNDITVAEATSMTIIVEGYWHKRWWKSPRGQWRYSLELHVARFHYRDPLDGAKFHEKGRLLEMA